MGRLRVRGGFRDAKSFQTATIIYDATYWFCEKFMDQRSRTVDQMIQAARSGRQNIAEGSRAAGTSSQSELKLLNVARSSLDELLLDYEDFLRHRRMTQWEPESPEALAVRNVPVTYRRDHQDDTDISDLTDHERWDLYSRWLDHNSPAVRVNAMICLINQASYLLDQQIDAFERTFIQEGGYREQLFAARLAHRNRANEDPPDPPDPTDPPDQIPLCPTCGRAMVIRTARSGKNAGHRFLGCSGYPDCRAVREL